MGDNADALQSQQRGAPIFGVIEALLEIGEGAARQQVSHLSRNGLSQRFLQSGAHQVHYAFGGLQGNIADEAIADNNVHFTVVEVASFHIADEIQWQLLQKLKRSE